MDDAVVDFVCTAFPGPNGECKFVELEDGHGRSMNFGEWIKRDDGLVALRVPLRTPSDEERGNGTQDRD